MKRILYILLIFWIQLSFLNIQALWASNSDFFVVTAYYSPLPNQDHYSYSIYTKRERSYEEEKRLQWQWIRWASWKKVFPWMLAAPKNYKFWTKLYLEWLGVWEIADRGGAIVNKWIRGYDYDRIDIWMWYGDEWLKRANNWWKRRIKGSFVKSNNKITINYENLLSTNINQFSKKYSKKSINIFNKKLTTKTEILKLQEILKELNLYHWKNDWLMTSLVSSIYDFQISNKIVKSEYSPWAWTYWPKTRKVLKVVYNKFLAKKEKERLELVRIEEEEKKEKLRLEKIAKEREVIKKLSYKKANNLIKTIWNPKKWEVSLSVRQLQLTLKDLWYFNNKDTAIFWNITRESLISYQLDKKIIKFKNEPWAWVFWPKTKKALKKDLGKKFIDEITKKENTIFKI